MKAIVRSVPDSFVDCITNAADGHTIDVALARRQHAAYVTALEQLGLDIVRVSADEQHPDCVFTEDCAIVVDGAAIACTMANSPGRAGEQGPVLEALGLPVRPLAAPAAIDGGDVLQWRDRIHIGQSTRTNGAAVEQLQALLPDKDIVPVPVDGPLHLKTCTTIAGDLILHTGHVDLGLLPDLPSYQVPAAEAHGANCITIGDTVLLPDDCPHTAARLAQQGLEVVPVPMSEFRKADGSLTCLSIIY